MEREKKKKIRKKNDRKGKKKKGKNRNGEKRKESKSKERKQKFWKGNKKMEKTGFKEKMIRKGMQWKETEKEEQKK